jgi:hypothetical protein
MTVIPQQATKRRTWPTVHLFFAFAFAFLTNEAIHEFGHFLADRAAGVREVGVILDPFGGSHIVLGESLPAERVAFAAVAGPLLNLIVGLVVLALLWRSRRSLLLPLLLMGPVAMVQESVTLTLGQLTPGGDADLMVQSGVPALVPLAIGVGLLIGGLYLIAKLLPLAGVQRGSRYATRFGVIAGGMTSLMLLRFVASWWRSPEAVVENGVPLVFALLLALILAAVYPLLAGRQPLTTTQRRSAWLGVAFAAFLAAGTFAFQLLMLN